MIVFHAFQFGFIQRPFPIIHSHIVFRWKPQQYIKWKMSDMELDCLIKDLIVYKNGILLMKDKHKASYIFYIF